MSRHVKLHKDKNSVLFFGFDNPLFEFYYQEWNNGKYAEIRMYSPHNEDNLHVTKEAFIGKLEEYSVLPDYIELVDHFIPF